VARQQASLDEYAHGHHDGGVPASKRRMTLKAGHVSRLAMFFSFFLSFFLLFSLFFPPKIASSKGKHLDRVNKFFSELQCSATTTKSCGHHTHIVVVRGAGDMSRRLGAKPVQFGSNIELALTWLQLPKLDEPPRSELSMHRDIRPHDSYW
jgi:hypothetical protein